MLSTDIQLQLFQVIKRGLPPHASMVDDVAKVLEVSIDSAYRRIRGEKPITLEEVYKLCIHYSLSLDTLFNQPSGGFLFKGKFFEPENFRFDEYLKSYAYQMKFISGFDNRKLFILCKDIPVHHHFHFKEIAAFKHYFWMRTIMNAPDYINNKFSLAEYPGELYELGRTALGFYNKTDSVELWNFETIISTLRQIEYYQDSNVFARTDEIPVIYDGLEKLLVHIERQADLGFKFDVGDEQKQLSKFGLYFNEVILGDNSVTAVLDKVKMVFIPHSVFNFMSTDNIHFCENNYKHIQNLMKKSTLISDVSERERSRFFNYLRNRIATRKEKSGRTD
ncbi:MAG TPA: hypothetical protein VM935_08200 [Chitinophagaceae bacterium]|nr:hypothetical protein [Chitinophagaceae bacterium]